MANTIPSVTVVIDNQAVCLPVGYSIVHNGDSLTVYSSFMPVKRVGSLVEAVEAAWHQADFWHGVPKPSTGRTYEYGKQNLTAYQHVCASLGYAQYAAGVGYVSFDDPDDLIGKVMELQILEAEDRVTRVMRPKSEWDEVDGNVLWWSLPLREPPYVGTPLDDDFPEHVTHWTIIPTPIEPAATEETEA